MCQGVSIEEWSRQGPWQSKVVEVCVWLSEKEVGQATKDLGQAWRWPPWCPAMPSSSISLQFRLCHASKVIVGVIWCDYCLPRYPLSMLVS